VRLPRLHESQRQTDVEAPSMQYAVPQRILIADDNVDLAESMAMLLRFEGHEVRIANDGPTALSLAEEFAPETAILDIGLPGLNGYQLGQKLRSRRDGEKLLLIAVTGYGQLEDRERSREAGFDCHLVKPLEPHVLGAEIAKRAAVRKSPIGSAAVREVRDNPSK
jgi:DNA-binding response OmpR family regulator